MKTRYYHTFLMAFFAAVLFAGCKKDFLERLPQTAITSTDFFKTVADMETYSNGFYEMSGNTSFGPGTSDVFSDNISVYLGGSEVDNMIRGNISASNVSSDSWKWDNLRRINYMLNNLQNVKGDQVSIDHFKGIARFYRAVFYFQMMKRFGDVPFYNTVLGATDDAALYKPKDPRSLVADSVRADFEFAAAHVKADGSATRITKWASLSMLARFCLFEGTFRKYHDELNLQSTANSFLERAVSASQEVMAAGFSIYNTGKKAEDYQKLFTSTDLSSNKEMIFYQDYDQALNRSNSTHYVFDWQWSLSKSLADTYLMLDGTPFTSSPGYSTKPYVQMFSNRDPRMATTIMPPGFSTVIGGIPNKTRPTFGGYPQIKFYALDPSTKVYTEFTDLPVIRYAEVLLINAEAKTELNTLTQSDLDKTVNLLRSRVGMPALNMTTANAQPDPVLVAMYPLTTGANQGVLLEIRRERNVELACEGFRFDDLLRWKAGKLLAKPTQGMYVPALGAYDVTGDGVEDIAILNSPSETGPISSLPESVRSKLVLYYLNSNSFYLSEGTKGFVMFPQDISSPRSFIEPKYYYFPIPLQQIVLNPKLTQPTGWQ
ncbi:RagB/SusD family nutrient uptake outer membrane protein [Pedobacter nutrimenti]|uniref:RagB/SusD family nutrient uptake outer membrane protein n=1 Tax=Pedobacter nutrimenti TaxID=1241337 RepID=UPI00293065BA|nr:RagB/SusD family nutrient uptake outer membrane protein [Pedobacter nutrimenti]